MHAFGGSDPVFLKLTEMAAADAGNLEAAECRACHSPALVRQEKWLANLPPGSNPAIDDLTHDGISCDFCHSIQRVPPVGDISWFDEIDPTAPKLGSINDPIPNSFHESQGDDSFRTSIQCASCHQLEFSTGMPRQNTYDEWLNAAAGGNGFECQDCHMPRYDGPAADGGPERSVHRHTFVGVGYALTDFRGIDRERQLDEIRELLQGAVFVTPAVPTEVDEGGSLDLLYQIRSVTGHAIPSGVSEGREMWLQLDVRDQGGQQVFRSGWLEANSDLVAPEDDPQLTRFTATMYDAADEITHFTWRAARKDESEILQAGDRRDAAYSIPIPVGTTGPLTVNATLRFRPIKPVLLRITELEELAPIEIFDMWELQSTVDVLAP